MTPYQQRSVLFRVRPRLVPHYTKIRDRLEWLIAHLLWGRPPWSQNRLGQRFLSLSLNDYQYLRDGNPEVNVSLLIERILRPGMIVVDVGANHGCFTMEAAHFVGQTGSVHAFEPAPRTRLQLQRHLETNGLNNVKVFSAAAGDTIGTGRLRVHHDHTGLNTLALNDIYWLGRTLKADEVIEVPIVSLDAHAASQGLSTIDLLKIDVEGFELAVVRGARGLLTTRRIAWIILEIADCASANAGLSPVALLNELDRLGYPVYEITSRGEIGERVRGPRPFPGANFIAHPAEGGPR